MVPEILEALASGTPVIGISNETIDELINGKNGIKLEKDVTPKQFAKTIKKFLDKNDKQYEKASQSLTKL